MKELLREHGILYLSGNEAIARGAIEAGVSVVTSYPGNPITEITETIASVAKDLGIYVEWSSNEKVAIEVAAGAAIAGLRSMTAMKHVGLNWALDPLMCINHSGVNGGMVVVVGDDPGSRSSQNEMDSRFLGLLSELVVLEPSGPAEAKEMVKYGFELSEKLKTPVILRSVQRVSHGYEAVELKPIPERPKPVAFDKNDERFLVTGAMARSIRLHRMLHEKLERAKEIVEKLPFNVVRKNGEIGIITAGLGYNIAMEAVKLLGLTDRVSVLKLGASHPLPRSLIYEFCKDLNHILAVEEVEPFIELQLKALLKDLGLNCKVHGRGTGALPPVDELKVEDVVRTLSKIAGVDPGYNAVVEERNMLVESIKNVLVSRPLTMCPGCPHRATFYALKTAVVRTLKDNVVYCGDIGCYSFASQPPFRLVNVKYSMGASIGVAIGLSKTHLPYKPVALIGDSTFFHAGIPALIDAVYNDANILVVILDNMVVGMTGQQPDPGTGRRLTGESATRIMLEDLVKALGVKFVRVADSLRVKELQKVFEEALSYQGPGPAVVISRSLCTLEKVRQMRRSGLSIPKYRVIVEKCKNCGLCTNAFACPALIQRENYVEISEIECAGCGVCAEICPFDAIVQAS